MKKKSKTLFALLIGSFLHSATNLASSNEIDHQAQEVNKTPLQETQAFLVKQAFLSIKPQSESVAHAYESIRKLVKEENTNKVLMSVRPLFTDRESYLKALAVQAEAEQYPIFAA